MNEEYDVKTSPLCQPVTRNRDTVQVDFFEDGAGGWILEVIDEYNNSTVWDDPFKKDMLGYVRETHAVAELIGP